MALQYMTQEGLDKLKKELAEAIAQRPVISAAIAEARDKGDLSENAEYEAAREAQGLLELNIAKLQNLVANARVIDESQIGTDKVQMLNKVKVKNLNTNQIMNFTLVSKLAGHEVRFLLTHESKVHYLVGIEILDLHLIEHLYLISTYLGLVDYTRIRNKILKFGYIEFKKALSLTGSFILCIFGKVSLISCLCYGSRNHRTLRNCFRKFLFQFIKTLLGHVMK